MFYQYRAIKDNKKINKKIEADNETTVLDFLRENGYFPIEIKKIKKNKIFPLDSLFNRVSFNDIVDFTRQLAIMLNAGLTIVAALDILKKQIKKEALKKLIEEIDKDIKAGIPLSSVLTNQKKLFSNLYISLVRSGEASGKLSDILLRLAENLEKQREFRKKLKGALIYPAVIVSAMITVMFIMITFVVPRMLNLYKDFNIELPVYTKILIAISSFSSTYWLLIVAFVAGLFFGLRFYLKTKKGKRLFDSLILRVPSLSNVVKMAALVDTTRTLAILIGSGVSILDSLDIVIETTNNQVYKESFQNIYDKIQKGGSLGRALDSEGIFPPILVQMAIVGENTGHLDDTLSRLSKYFEFESESAIKTVTTLIEPTVLIFLGLGVAFIVLAVITPIYKLTSSFQ